jgi:hypothetical protein
MWSPGGQFKTSLKRSEHRELLPLPCTFSQLLKLTYAGANENQRCQWDGNQAAPAVTNSQGQTVQSASHQSDGISGDVVNGRMAFHKFLSNLARDSSKKSSPLINSSRQGVKGSNALESRENPIDEGREIRLPV